MTWCRPRSLRPCPTALPELSHALGHPASELAAQFDQILNLSGTFAPLLPLDAALTFWAPLDYMLADLRGAPATFNRDTAAVWRRDDGELFLLPSQQARFEKLALLVEPASTNKCTNFNAEPDAALTNVVEVGNAAAVISRVQDEAALTAAGLNNLGNGYAFEIDNNQGGSGSAALRFGGQVGNLNQHAISAWCRRVSPGGLADLRLSDGAGATAFTSSAYERIGTPVTPTLDFVQLQVQVNLGVVARVVLNQLEEIDVISSEIITQGAAASRSVDALSYGGLANFFNQAQGMALMTWRPRFAKAQQTAVDALLSVTNTTRESLIYYDGAAFRSNDGATVVSVNTPAFADGDIMKVAMLYGPGGTDRQIGYSLNGAAWVWSGAGAYRGSFVSESDFYVGRAAVASKTLNNVQLWKENRGAAWVQDNY